MGRIYLAGPMHSWQPHMNFPAFFEAQARLEEAGWVVSNPAREDMAEGFDPDNPPPPSPARRAATMERDLSMVLSADAIALLPGWETSPGALQELSIACWTGKQVVIL